MSLHEQQIDNLISAHTELSKRLTEAEATAALVPGLREEIERLQKENQELIEAFANYPTWIGQKLALARNPDVARSVS